MAVKQYYRASILGTAMDERWAHHHVPKTHHSPQMVERNLKLCCAFHFDLQCFVIQMHKAPCGRTLRTSALSSGASSLRGGCIRATFDDLPLVINHPIGRVPDAPHPHRTLTVRTDERVPPRARLVPLPV